MRPQTGNTNSDELESDRMLIVARMNKGSELGPPDHGHGYSLRSQFPVTLGREYEVFAMNLYDHQLRYLIFNDAMHPDWLPTGLFEVLDGKLPSDWQFRDTRESEGLPPGKWGLGGLWGYPELVRRVDHYEGLLELNEADILTFLEVRQRYAKEAPSA